MPAGIFVAVNPLKSALTFTSFALLAAAAQAQSTEYRISFQDRVHHVLQVEATFRGIPASQPLRVQMSRSSPGRYAAFEYAENLFDEQITGADSQPLKATRPDPRTWQITGHKGTVHITYHLFGDRVDGTFMAVDTTHAHLNWPATVLWAHGLEEKPTKITFVLPTDSKWKIATQLYPTSDPTTFTAPNLQYLMDSPAELSDYMLRTFTVAPLTPGGKTQTIRVVVHTHGTDAQMDAFTRDVETIVREQQAIYGELPDYEPGYYTFLCDYLPWDNGDGMEHRNSTVITQASAFGNRRLIGTVAHEYFHNWNVERIRPQGLEPFNFADVNMSFGMFLAEGFTQYYGPLAQARGGIIEREQALAQMAGAISAVQNSPGTKYRSATDMSRFAPFADGASRAQPVYNANTFVSYYTFGAAIATGLDLSLRSKTNGKVSLDDFMRAMWKAYGKPGGSAPGLVGHPYTLADVKTQLALVSGDKAWADDFVTRYMDGTDRIDYAPLLLRAGYVLRPVQGQAVLGVRVDKKGNAAVVDTPTIVGSPAYNAGLDLDDELISIAGTPITAQEDVVKVVAGKKAGDQVELVFKRRGEEIHATATLAPDQRLEIVSVPTPTEEQKAFREAWLGSKVK